MNEIQSNQTGITLIALVITIIVLLILAGVSIGMLTGDNGIITNAQESKISTELAEYKEQLELYIAGKKIQNINFDQETLFAGQYNLKYNTQENGETGTIKTIFPNMKSNYTEKIQIKKGKIVLDTKDKKEIKVAIGLGIEVNPYEIIDGELISSENNLLLIDSNGTLKLPESVTSIGEGAFANTASDGVELKKVIIPSTVREIKSNAFNGNSQIEEIIIEAKGGKGVTKIGDFAFAGCTKLRTIKLPDTVTTIGRNLFEKCSSLQDVKLSKNITRISYEMFKYCKEMQNIEIPENVTTIEAGAFGGCINFTKIKIPSALKIIGSNAFTGCLKLNLFDIGNNTNFVFENGILMNKEKTQMYFISNLAINGDTFTVPKGITELPANLLNENGNGIVKKVILPESVNRMEISFFPYSVEEIEIDGNNPNYIVNNKSIYDKEKTILYMNFTKDAEITVEEGVKIIEPKAFQLTNATKINFPNSLEEIEDYAICKDTVKSINIGKNVKKIGVMAFYGCLKLEEVTIDKENGMLMVENGIIYNKNKTEVISVATYQEKITIANGVTKIPNDAFSEKNKTKIILMPQSITYIGNNAFLGCTELTKIEIPSNVDTIGENCFLNTPKLKEIIIDKEKGSISGSPWGNNFGERAIIWKK